MRVFHKCTLGGLIGILKAKENKKYELFECVCGSTEDCHQLFSRDYCVVFEIKEENLKLKSNNDIDARTITPWNEVRFEIEDAEIIEIIGSRRFYFSDYDLEYLVNRIGFDYEYRGNHDQDLIDSAKDYLRNFKIIPTAKSKYDRNWLNM